MARRLTSAELNQLFISDIGNGYTVVGEQIQKPIIISPFNNKDVKYKVYIYNCTNPPGGRTLDEYKIQLIVPGQGRGQRCYLDESDGTIILIVGFAVYDSLENGVWIIWETDCHREL